MAQGPLFKFAANPMAWKGSPLSVAVNCSVEPGPTVGEGLLAVARALHPDAVR